MSELYTIRHLTGGFILTLFFMLVFTANMASRVNFGNNLNPAYFLIPVLVALAISMILYISRLRESINLQTKVMSQTDNFHLENCPPKFKKRIADKGKTEICEAEEVGNPVPNFYLDSKDELCGGDLREDNGCFNRYSTRIQKCNRLKDYFKVHEEMLNTWTDFRDNCTLN